MRHKIIVCVHDDEDFSLLFFCTRQFLSPEFLRLRCQSWTNKNRTREKKIIAFLWSLKSSFGDLSIFWGLVNWFAERFVRDLWCNLSIDVDWVINSQILKKHAILIFLISYFCLIKKKKMSFIGKTFGFPKKTHSTTYISLLHLPQVSLSPKI